MSYIGRKTEELCDIKSSSSFYHPIKKLRFIKIKWSWPLYTAVAMLPLCEGAGYLCIYVSFACHWIISCKTLAIFKRFQLETNKNSLHCHPLCCIIENLFRYLIRFLFQVNCCLEIQSVGHNTAFVWTTNTGWVTVAGMWKRCYIINNAFHLLTRIDYK